MEAVGFGRYQLLELIGEGGMGKVYRAHDTMIERDVAIKVLPAELGAEPGYRDRFRREAHTAARLAEPHIIPIYDTGEIDGQLYLVMPVVNGTDLDTLLRTDGAMPPARAVRVIEQLAAALNTAHGHGLVHRDVKPSNALLTGDDFVYLIDFGIVHDAEATRLTRTGFVLGTLSYMAPERFETGIADARSDVYALACVLHECLTAQPPYLGDSLPQLMNAHLNMPPPAPSGASADIPVRFDEVVALGMAKDPGRRYQTAGELAAAARTALTAPSPAPTAPRRSPTAPHPARTAADPKLTEPGPTIRPATSAPPERPALRRPAPRRKGDNRWLVLGVAAVVAGAAVTGVGIYFATKGPNNAPAPPARAAPPGAPGALDGLLLSPAEINAAMGATGMTVSTSFNTLSEPRGVVAPPECQFVASPSQTGVYAGSGWTAARGQSLREPDQPFTHAVYQRVVLFASPQAAAAFVNTASQSWSACTNRSYTVTDKDRTTGKDVTSQFTSGPLGTINGVLSIPSGPVDPRDPPCQRALTSANNVVVETSACENNVTDQAVRIATLIAAKIPK